MDYAQLKTELDDDPKALGYAGMSTQEVADIINTVGATDDVVDREVIDSYEIVNATTPSEWNALSAEEKQRYGVLISAGKVDVKNNNVRTAFAAMFGAGTATRTALIALQIEPTNRAKALGFDRVEPWDVERARAL